MIGSTSLGDGHAFELAPVAPGLAAAVPGGPTNVADAVAVLRGVGVAVVEAGTHARATTATKMSAAVMRGMRAIMGLG